MRPTYLFMQLHTGDPGPDGNDNVAINNARQPISMSVVLDGTLRNEYDVQWKNVPATEHYTAFTVWNSPKQGDLLWISQNGDLHMNVILTGYNCVIARDALVITLDRLVPKERMLDESFEG